MPSHPRPGAVALLLACLAAAPAHAGDPAKPYVFLIVDTSGSMINNSTGFGPPSCAGAVDTRLDHAKCAIYNLTNSYGDMVLGLGRFRETTNDGNCSNGCAMSGIDCSACDPNTGSNCTSTMSSDARLEVLVGLEDGNNGDLARWNDFTCGTCGSVLANNPDIYAAGWTPIAGSLKGAKRYFQGLQASDGTPLWPSGSPGYDPIRNDPLHDVFLPSGPQCRPYIVISLTDGEETCTTFNNTTAAAAALLDTQVTIGAQTYSYRIETKPIGFGVAPGDPSIEGVAHAGGAPDVAGVNEGLYASNEEELQLAISQIIADALRFEQCNELDDDCDLAIDEDFPSKGQACDDGQAGICRGTGVRVCDAAGTGTTCMITNPGAMPGTEVCNNLDDDCDNKIDEGLVRSCGTDVGECTAGTETCVAGMWQGCTATGPFTETCDGLDNDCDGVPDGLSETCTNIPGGNPDTGPCHPGTRVCPPDGSGTWGACLGEVGPVPEACDTVDNDCDTTVDEDTGGADCSSTCGMGTTVCVNGVIECQGSTSGGPEMCNGFDDDCDNQIDEGLPDMGPCNMAPDGTPLCMPGVLRCLGGSYVCDGGQPSTPEVCDCVDNDCDSSTDEEPPALCPAGASCTQCQCAYPCAAGEFPCPLGRTCSQGFCVLDTCFDVTCDPLPNGDLTVCEDGACVRACDRQTCPTGYVCVGPLGQCRPDDCTTFPDRCTASQVCTGGECVDDPCAGVSCTGGQYCTGGTCVSSCAGVSCPSGQRCRLGECQPDPCGAPCPGGQVCIDATGTCTDDPCVGSMCAAGQACDPQTGECGLDPCLGVTCPGAGEQCVQGTCDQPPAGPDAGVDDEVYVTAAGGGCCDSGAGGTGPIALALLVAAGLLRPGRRRPARARSRGRGVRS